MPTGYTDGVRSGEVTSFAEYALECARAFGALIMLRDEPKGIPIPELEPDEHYIKNKDDAARELLEIRTRTPDDWRKAYHQYAEETIARREESLARIAEERARCTAMLEKARMFKPPSNEHANYAKFLCSQLEESIAWDCSTKFYDELTVEPFEKWKNSTEEMAWRRLDMASKSLSDEIERCSDEIERYRSRNEWVRQLREAIAEVGD